MAGLLAAAVSGLFCAQLAWSAAASAGPVLQPCSASYIGVPGSGQSSTSSVEMDTLGAWVQADSGKAGQKLRSSTLLSYPAVAWYHYVKPRLKFNWDGLGSSEVTGEKNLTALIKSDRARATAAGCANAPILIAGYSQGAEVAVRTIDALSRAARNTISVALLGNPSFTANVPGDLDLNKYAYYGIRPSFLAGQRYTLKSDVISRTIDLCAASDPICAYHLSLVPGLADGRSAHYHYGTLTYQGLTLVNYAANFLWGHRAGAWIPTEAPLPANARGSTGEALSGVSCPSAAHCVAVGNYDDDQGGAGLLLTDSGGSWTAAPAPVPGKAGSGAGNGTLSGVSCPSISHCVAVGSYDDAASVEEGLVVTGSGGSWTAVKAPLPANSGAGYGIYQALLTGVSCSSASQCVAVGEYWDSQGGQHGLLLTLSKGSWRAAEAPLPDVAAGGGWLTGVSCPSASQCVAVGEYGAAGTGGVGMLLTSKDGSWKAAQAPRPANSAEAGDTVSAVSCPSVSQCVAVGNYGPSTNGQMGLLLTDSGGSWKAAEAPLAANGVNGGVGGLPGVSCGAAGQCVAVGQYFSKSGDDYDQGLLLTDSGGSWKAAQAPLPANTQKAFGTITQGWLNAVSCPPAAQCVAVGNYAATSGSGGLLLTQASPS